jgi:uncharacterized protein (DUF58 family)
VLSDELLKKVRLIEFTTRKTVDDVMTGQFKSRFKGQGVQFSEHRQYVPGDDVRHIDWKVSARSRDPLIKKYEEERELTVLILVDVSGSKSFGSHQKVKSEVAAELAGMLAYAAIHTGDKVGVLLFSETVELIIRPKKGRSHIQRIIRDVLSFEPKKTGTSIHLALDAANRIMKHSGVVFVLSDFYDQGYDIALRRLSRRHDVTAFSIRDPREKEVPSLGLIHFADAESGEEQLIDTSSYAFREWFAERDRNYSKELESAVKSCRVDHLALSSSEDFTRALVRFFQIRLRKGRRR